jgi:hypothetical protein
MSVVIWKFLTLGRHAQAITKAILEKKSARRHARSRTRFEFNISAAPDQWPVPGSYVHIRGGSVGFQGSPTGRHQFSPGAWIS